ncbi:CRISPR-associated helicase/endonuclease Cas3 [soil metagenome]
MLLETERTEYGLRELFKKLTKLEAHDFQVEVARRLLEGENLVLVSPTGSGKSWPSLLAFIYARRSGISFADRLIYAFPLRTLTTALYQQYGKYLEQDGLKATLQIGGMERGEGDPFFDQGDVIFTTIDQLLSSYIGVPVSLPQRLANLPAGALIGSCVVFDEFHLLEPDKALATTLDLADRLKPYAQVLLMSATFSGEGIKEMQRRAHAGKREVSPEEIKRPERSETRRRFVWAGREITAEAILDAHQERSIAVCNTVDRATEVYRNLVALAKERGIGDRILLLHARFLPEDRKAIEAKLLDLFGKESVERAILVATQVAEVGLDISSESLHTEAAPASAIFQRAGRCARFEGDGNVYVYELPTNNDKRITAPYVGTQAPLVDSTINELMVRSGSVLDFDGEREVLNEVHAEADLRNLKSVRPRRRRREVVEAIRKGSGSYIRELVREVDAINLVIHPNPEKLRMELPVPSVSVSRSVARKFLAELNKTGQIGQALTLSAESQQESENYAPRAAWKAVEKVEDLSQTFYLCLPPSLASYSPDEGLVLGRPGSRIFEQDAQVVAYEPYSYRKETWRDHIRRVMEQYKKQEKDHRVGAARLAKDLGIKEEAVERMGLLVAALHDLGKLSAQWQDKMWLWQQSVKPDEPRDCFLGHSDFDGADREQRERIRNAMYRKPPHAVESYYAGLRLLHRYFADEPDDLRSDLVVALGSAIARHHSAFARNLGEFRLGDGYEREANDILNRFGLDADLKDRPKTADRQVFAHDWFVDPEEHESVFSLYRYVVRRLRLADQKSNDW